MEREDQAAFDEGDLERILELVEKSDFNYFELTARGVRLVVSKTPLADVAASSSPLPQKKESPPPEGSDETRLPAEEPPRAAPGGRAKDATEAKAQVKSPIMGTFYRSPSPGAPPFVEVGDRVDEATTVCIIEVMKVMTSVKAGVKGRITEVLARNGELIEYDQPLFVVEPEE